MAKNKKSETRGRKAQKKQGWSQKNKNRTSVRSGTVDLELLMDLLRSISSPKKKRRKSLVRATGLHYEDAGEDLIENPDDHAEEHRTLQEIATEAAKTRIQSNHLILCEYDKGCKQVAVIEVVLLSREYQVTHIIEGDSQYRVGHVGKYKDAPDYWKPAIETTRQLEETSSRSVH